MPPSFFITKQNPVVFNDKVRPPPVVKAPCSSTGQRSSSSTSSSSSRSIPASDKSTATVSTAELSFSSSIASSSTSFSKLASSSSSRNTSQVGLDNTSEIANANISKTNSSSSSDQIRTSRKSKKQSPLKSLDAPSPLHPQLSLLDMTMDESHDDESYVCPTNFKTTSSPSPNSKSSYPKNNNNNSSSSSSSSSIMEQTGINLAAISESMSGSFCANQNDVNNSCTITMPDCTNYNSSSTKKNKKALFGDTLVQNRLLEDFTYILGSNVMPCCEEKTIFSSCFGLSSSSTSVSNVDEDYDEFAYYKEEDKIRNRAGESWRARAYRIRKLREERMIKCDEEYTYMEYTLSNRRQVSMERSSHGGFDSYRNSSFRDVKKDLFQSNDGGDGRRRGGGRDWRRPKHEVQSDPLGRLIGDCIDPIAPVKEDSVELEAVWKEHNDIDLCYDSDPGETSFRKPLATDGGEKNEDTKRSSMPNSPTKRMGRTKSLGSKLNFGRKRRNQYSSLDCYNPNEEKINMNGSFDVQVSIDHDTDDDDDSYCSYDNMNAQPEYRPWFDRSPKLHQVRSKALQEDIGISQNVQNALNRTWTLTWHPINQIKAQERKTKITIMKTLSSSSAVSPEATTQYPRAVRLWFERGNRIRGNNIVEPKLMWRDAYHPELSTHRRLNDSITNGPNQICLLSICRILDVKDLIDRKLYPFAKKTCSFLIRTCDDEEYLFETQSEKERDELVYLWKLVVARLASQAVVGDGDKMVGEFFVPSNFGVP